MGFLILIIAIVLVCAGIGSSGYYYSESASDFGSLYKGSSSRERTSHDNIEESDIFFDRNRDEHILIVMVIARIAMATMMIFKGEML
jgi:hypothetical protein